MYKTLSQRHSQIDKFRTKSCSYCVIILIVRELYSWDQVITVPTIQVSEKAYALIVQRAKDLQRTPDEVASELILSSTEHPYVECKDGVLDGKPVIKGTRIAVWQLAKKLQLGDSINDLCETYSHVPEAAIYDAISYYFDHRGEINLQVDDNQIENVLAKHGATMDERGMVTTDALRSK